MFKLPNVRHPRSLIRNAFLGGLGGVIGVMSGIIAVALYIVNVLTSPKHLDSFGQYYFTPFELGMPAEEVTFAPLYGDHEVNGWYIPRADATTTIVLSPGFRMARSDVLGLCGHLWKAGHNVLAFEYYGHGTVVGKPVTLGYREINDFLGALNYARARAPQARLGVVGYSMGAVVSIIGSARAPEVEALVVDSAFATHRRVVEYGVHRVLHLPFILFAWTTDLLLWLRAGYRFRQVEPLRDIGRISPRPIMIIQGTKDSVVNPQDAFLLYEAAGEPKELWKLPGVDHVGAYFDDRVEYTRRVVSFFDLYLSHKDFSTPKNEQGWQTAEK